MTEWAQRCEVMVYRHAPKSSGLCGRPAKGAARYISSATEWRRWTAVCGMHARAAAEDGADVLDLDDLRALWSLARSFDPKAF